MRPWARVFVLGELHIAAVRIVDSGAEAGFEADHDGARRGDGSVWGY